jgi:pectate lyase
MVLSAVLCAALVGFGADTPGGRGGRVLRVTTLGASGPGSLREALETKGPRIVRFDVGGVIDLAGGGLLVTEPFLTIAGETAPPPGITLIGGSLRIMTHDVIMQHLRVRPGDGGRPKKSGWEPEVTTSGPQAYNIVIDHCSFSWAVDENLSVSGPRHDGPEGTSRNITLSNNIIAEGLRDSSHSKGPHSMGTLVHDYCNRITIVGNLYAHNNNRNPYFKAFTTGVVVNNLIYNPGARAIAVDYNESEWQGTGIQPRNARIAVVGNVFVPGADTRPGMPLVGRRGDVYLEDNIAPILKADEVVVLKEKPLWPDGLAALPASKVIEHVLANAGARPHDRDEVDRRIVREFRERTGRIIDSQEEVGGYPSTRQPARP